MQFSYIHLLALLTSVSASVLSTTNVATVLATVANPCALTIPADAISAMAKLGTGGVNAATLTTAEKAAIDQCRATGLANNTASKAGLSDGRGSPGAIAFVTNKVTTHACQTAQQQIALQAGTAASDNAVNLLISNIGVLNVQTAAAKRRRALQFKA